MIQDELPGPALRKLAAFKRAGLRLCQLVDNHDRYKEVELCRRLELALIDILSTGHRLPSLDPWADEPGYDENDETSEAVSSGVTSNLQMPEPQTQRVSQHLADYYRAHDLLEPRFVGRDYYIKTFDPYSPDPTLRDQVTSSLTDDLAEIYAFVKEECRNDEAPEEKREPPYLRLWHWKFGYDKHVAVYHLPHSITALTFLLRSYWDDDEGWSEIWQPDSPNT